MQMDSPEERLLRLIKGRQKKKIEAKQAQPSDKKSFFVKVTKNVFLKSKIFKPPFLKPVNGILVIILILALIYLADILLFTPSKDIDSIVRERSSSPIDIEAVPAEKPVWTAPLGFSDYSDQIKGKNLFSSKPIEESLEGPNSTLDVYKRFNLVGIITGAEPQAILEDKDTNKTHYLYKGQSINGVTVKEIGEGKVTLDYKGREMVLVL